MALKKWKMNCHLEYPVQKNKTSFSDNFIPLLQETTKKVVLQYFPPENLVNSK